MRVSREAMRSSISFENLKNLIYATGSLSVNELAHKLGIAQPTLYRLLNGKTLNPKKEILQKIANYLEMPLKTLMDKITLQKNYFVEVPVFKQDYFNKEGVIHEENCFKKVQFEIEENDTSKYIGIFLENFKSYTFFCEKVIIIVKPEGLMQDRCLAAFYAKNNNSIIIERIIREGTELYIKAKKSDNNELYFKKINDTEFYSIGTIVEIRFLEST